MKLRRFTPDGVEAVRATLPKIEATGDLSLATAPVSDPKLTEDEPGYLMSQIVMSKRNAGLETRVGFEL